MSPSAGEPTDFKPAGSHPQAAADLDGVLTARPENEAWTYDDGERLVTVKPSPVLRLASMVLIRDAVLAGAGVGLLTESIAGPEIAAGRLARWGRLVGRVVEMWVLHPSARLRGPKVELMLNVLAETFTR